MGKAGDTVLDCHVFAIDETRQHLFGIIGTTVAEAAAKVGEVKPPHRPQSCHHPFVIEFIGRFRQIFFTGEGHFSVAKNKEKPFIIKSNESSIEVLGTQFNLKSYSNDNRIEVALLDGSVAFCYPSTTDQEMKCILSPGEQVYYNRTTHNLEKKNFILSDYSSWKDGKYYFKNETLENIAKQLERNFDVNIIIKNDSLKQIPYHMAFVNNETLDDILSAMNLDGYLTIKRDGKIIEIY